MNNRLQKLMLGLIIVSFFINFNIGALDNPSIALDIDYPDYIEVPAGGSATFQVNIKVPPLHYIYLKRLNGNSNATMTDFYFSNSSSLQIDEVTVPNGRKYIDEEILDNKGTFVLRISAKRKYTVGARINETLYIKYQLSNPKKKFAPVTITKPVTILITQGVSTGPGNPGDAPSGYIALNPNSPGRPTPRPTPKPAIPPTVKPWPTEKPQPPQGNREIRWVRTYKQALGLAAREQKNIFIFASSDSYREMDAVFRNPTVAFLLAEGFIAFRAPDRINGRKNPDIARLGIKSFPAILVYNRAGKRLYAHPGGMNARELIEAIASYSKVKPPKTVALPEILSQTAAVLHLHDRKVVFFLKNGQFAEYTLGSNEIPGGYPREVNNSEWPGLAPYAHLITAALEWDSKTAHIFLKNGTYLRLNLETRQIDPGYPKPITDTTWPGLGRYKDKIVAAAHVIRGKIYFFLNDGSYISFDQNTLRMDRGFPQQITNRNLRGLGRYANSILGGVNPRDGFLYLVVREGKIIKYDLNKNMMAGETR